MMRSPTGHRSVFLVVLLICSLLTVAPSTYGQAPEGPDTTESTTEDATGVVVGLSPYFTITVQDRKGPFMYRLSQDFHAFGPDNHPLKVTEIRVGDEVTVFYYYRDGHPTVIRVVVLQRGGPGRK